MQFPREIFDLIFQSLSRHDLWSVCLVSRRLNEIASPTLYRTIIIALWCGVTLPPKFIRSLVFCRPNHSKIHLIKNVVLLAQIESPDNTDGSIWERGARRMVNEMVYGFLEKLKDGQLRRFIWRSTLNPDGRILVHLANHHGSSLECLYLDVFRDLKDADMLAFDKFSSLSALRWGKIEAGRDMLALMKMLNASADSLRTLSVDYAFPDILQGDRDAIAPYFDAELDLTEYQTPIRGVGRRIVNSVVPFSQIQRFRLPNPQQSVYLLGMIECFDEIIELDFNYTMDTPDFIELSIAQHAGSDLKILSMCTISANPSEPFTNCLSTETLLELGRGCPNLAELAISREFDLGIAQVWDRIRTDVQTAPKPLAGFPLSAFPNLELLFIAIPASIFNESILEDQLYHSDTTGNSSLIKAALEAMLGEEKGQRHEDSDSGTPALPAMPSKKLNVVALGMGNPELLPFHNTTRTPRLFRVVHPPGGSGPITLNAIRFEDIMDNDPGWKLLRRYPLLIPNEGLRGVFRRPHLPPASELIPVLN
ncbi:hypothetical protein TWF481_007699 [Arthrobotrys musiformis]|uniref:F-box domain-containing protein n=1 Tax=Arthrobotrys musiformis TaxID=47236 RepID=A0AAV9WC85_9PEZI